MDDLKNVQSYTPQPTPYTPDSTIYTSAPVPYTPAPALYTPASTAYTPAPIAYEQLKEQTPVSPEEAQNYLVRGNDPYEINSIMDVISNRAAILKNYGTDDIAAHFKALRDLFWYRTWKPLSKGDFGTVALNTLHGISEPLDVLGNVSKAIFTPWAATNAAKTDYDTAEKIMIYHANNGTPINRDMAGRNIYGAYVDGRYIQYTEQDLDQYKTIVNSGRTVNPYKLTTEERLLASVGLGKYGRINFSYDTGNVLMDMFLEVITDPETIISLGAGALTGVAENGIESSVKSAIKNIDTAALTEFASPEGKTALNSILEKIGVAATDEAWRKKVMGYMLNKEIKITAEEPAKMWLPKILGDAIKSTPTTKTFAINSLTDAMTVALYYGKHLNDVANPAEEVSGLLQRTMTKYVNTMTVNVLKTLKTTNEVINEAQGVLVKAALSTSGIYPTYELVKRGYPKIANWVNQILGDSAEIYANTRGQRSIISFADGLENYTRTNKTIADGLGDELAALYNPKYVTQFHAQMNDDMVFFDGILSKLSRENVHETLEAYTEYMQECHNGVSIRDLADSARKANLLLQGADAETLAYYKYTNLLAQRMSKLEAGVRFIDKANAANKIIETATSDALPKAHLFLLKENLTQTNDVAQAVFETAKQLDTMVDELVAPIRTLSQAAPALADRFKKDVTELYVDFLQAYAKDTSVVDKELPFKLYERFTQFTKDVQQIVNTFYNSGKAVVREQNAMQDLKLAIDANAKGLKKFMDTAGAAAEAEVVQRKAAGDYSVFHANSFETPLETPFAKSKVIKDFFGDADLKDPKVIADWYAGIKDWQNIEHGAQGRTEYIWRTDTVQRTFREFFGAPLNSPKYPKAFNQFQRFMRSLESDMGSWFKADSDELVSFKEMLDELNKINPWRLKKQTDTINQWSTMLRFKTENMAMLVSTLMNENMTNFMSQIRTGAFAKVTQALLTAPDVSEADKIIIGQISSMSQQFTINKELIMALNNAGIGETTRAGILASISSFAHMSADRISTNPDEFLQRLVDRAERNIQQTFQYDEALNLDYIFLKNKDKINELRAAYGLAPLEKEMHIATDDLLTTEYVLQNLLKDSPSVKMLLESDCKRIAFDFETWNDLITTGNQVHQIAVNTIEDGKLSQKVIGLKSDLIGDLYIPDHDYLNKLFPDMDYAAQKQAYLAVMNGEARSEKELLINFVSYLWDSIKAPEIYDKTADAYKAVFVTHNGLGFDLPLLKKKLQQYDLYNYFRNEAPEKVDLRFLDKVQMFDTLKLLREQKGYFKIGSDEVAELLPIFRNYAEQMSELNAPRLFNAVRSEDMQNLKECLSRLYASRGLTREFADEYDELFNGVEDAWKVLQDTANTNKILGNQLYPKHLFTSTLDATKSMSGETKEQWLQFFKDRGLSQSQIDAIFKDFDSVNASTLIGVLGSNAGLAYVKAVDADLVDKWFTGSALRVGQGAMTRKDAEILTSVSRQLERYAQRLYDPEELVQYAKELTTLTNFLFEHKMPTVLDGKSLLNSTVATFSGPQYLKYLRTENLNLQEQWAMFSFIANKYSKEEIDALSLDIPSDAYDYLFAKLNAKNTQNYFNLDQYLKPNNFTDAAAFYTRQYHQLLNLQQNFDQFSHYLDNPVIEAEPIFDGAAQLHRRAAEPVVNLVNSLKNFYRAHASSEAALKAAYDAEVTGSDTMAAQILKSFTSRDIDTILPWLADAKAPVMFRTAELSLADHEALINKFTSEAFRNANIKIEVDGYWTMVYLSKNAGLRATIDPDTGKILYWINGTAYEKPAWQQLDLAEIHNLAYKTKDVVDTVDVVNLEDLLRADDALYFMTEGASGHSLYESFSQKDFERIMTRLPQKVLDDLPDLDSYKNPVFWLGSQFNHAILGSANARKEMLDYSSGHLINGMQQATYRRLSEHGTVFVYAQALMNNVSAVRGNIIGDIMRDNPAEILNWIKGHDEYTAAALVKSKNSLGFEVLGFNMQTLDGIKAAYEANANIMTVSEYNKLYEVINQNIFSETQASTWLSIVRLYKIGYLATPGTWMRNIYDTLIKNTEATGENPLRVLQSYGAAFKDLRDYDVIVEELHNLGDDIFDDVEALLKYFEKNTRMDYDHFQYLHRFFNDAAAGGESSVYQKLNTQAQNEYWNALLQYGAVTPAMKESFERRRWFNNLTNKALNPMNEIERTARLAEYHLFTKQGLTNTKAIQMIEHTHYAYSVKSKLEQTMELVVPFYTFASRNLNYWMEVVEKNPQFLVALRDLLEPLWNLDQYDPDEKQGSSSLQNNIFAGNVPLGDSDWFLKTSFSFMDAFSILTDPANQTKSRMFGPIQAIVDVMLQHGSDELFKANRTTASNWLQNTFGLKITREQLEAKYGEWAKEYQKLYPYKVSSENPLTDLIENFKSWQYVPLIGTQVARFENTNMYYNGEGAKSLFYLTGLAGKRTAWSEEDVINQREKLRYKISALIDDSTEIKRKWQEVLQRNGYGDAVNLYMLDHNQLEKLWAELSAGYQTLNTRLYAALQADDDHIWMYSRLRAALGYKDVPMSQLPPQVKELLLSVINEQPTNVDLLPVLQNPTEFTFIWSSLKRKYGYADSKFSEIPSTKIDEMCVEIAKSALVLTDVRNMLSEDPSTRYSYSVAKKNLGYGDLQLYQIPCDDLKLIKAAMLNKVYGSAPASIQRPLPSYKPKKMYATKTWTNQTPYDTHQGVYPNYGHMAAQTSVQMEGLKGNVSTYRSQHPEIYANAYTKTGVSRMKLRMLPVTPGNARNQVKDLFSYYR